MALFRGVDSTLPLLSQIYQLDLQNKEELRAFLTRLADSPDKAIKLIAYDGQELGLAHVVNIARSIMRTIYQGETFTREQIDTWNTWLVTIHESLLPYDERNGTLHTVRVGTVAGLIGTFLLDLYQHPDRLQKCPECDNLFERSLYHPAQIHCSQRCRHRVGERRRRAERKEHDMIGA